MATSGSDRLIANNGSYDVPIDFSWTRDGNGVVSWKAQIYAIGGGTGQYDSSPCWTSFYIRGGNNSTGDLTGNLVEYCASCSQCAQYYQGNILWQHNDVRGGSLTGTINMGTGGGTLKLGYYGQRNGANTSEDYLTWSVDPAVSPPTGLNVTNVSATKDSVTANVSISGWGVGSGTRYRELQVWSGNMTGDRRYQPVNGDATSGNITCNNSSSGALTIKPNTTYTIGGYASNGQANTGSVRFGTATTKPEAPAVDLMFTSTDAVTFAYLFNDQGGASTLYIEYKPDGSDTWVVGAEVTGSGAKSGTITVNGLATNSDYTYNFRARSSNGWTEALPDVFFSTKDVTTRMYCSANGVAKRVTKVYCSVGGQRKRVKKIYGSVNGQRKLVWEEA